MKLQSKLSHMVNTTVRVDGTVYDVDGDGVVLVDNKGHAEKLLANEAGWRHYVERKRVSGVRRSQSPETPPETPPEVPSKEPESEDTEEDLPDPSMSMNLAELQELADKYELEYTPKTTKRQLVDAIMEAMYGE